MQQEKQKIKGHYDFYISSKQKGYEVTMKIINATIQRMVDSSVISDDVSICGRLKSFKSAYENLSRKKRLDDCFGIRIVAGTESELEEIRKALEAILVIKRNKNHKKNSNTKYDALHQIVKMKQELAEANNMKIGDFPVVEIQYWTRDIERSCVDGELAYSKYKQRDIQKIHAAYKKDPSRVYELLPIFYEASGEKISRLSPEQSLFKMYPELKRNKKDIKEPDECTL